MYHAQHLHLPSRLPMPTHTYTKLRKITQSKQFKINFDVLFMEFVRLNFPCEREWTTRTNHSIELKSRWLMLMYRKNALDFARPKRVVHETKNAKTRSMGTHRRRVLFNWTNWNSMMLISICLRIFLLIFLFLHLSSKLNARGKWFKRFQK